MKGIAIYRPHTAWDIDTYERGAVRKRAVINLFKSLGQVDVRNAAAVFKHVFFESTKLLGQADLGKRGASPETKIAYGFYTARNIYTCQGRAFIKCRGADYGYSLGQADLGKRGAATEGIFVYNR